MTHEIYNNHLIRIAISALAGASLGTFLGLASAQDNSPGQLDTACHARCTGNGYEAGFCNEVCWIPDPAKSAKGDGLDWKCMTACRERGGGAEYCMSGCRRY